MLLNDFVVVMLSPVIAHFYGMILQI